jgi:hypothetical protein
VPSALGLTCSFLAKMISGNCHCHGAVRATIPNKQTHNICITRGASARSTGIHSRTVKESALLGCDAVLTCKQLLTFLMQYDSFKIHSGTSHTTSIFTCDWNAMTNRLGWENPSMCSSLLKHTHTLLSSRYQMAYCLYLIQWLMVFWCPFFPSQRITTSNLRNTEKKFVYCPFYISSIYLQYLTNQMSHS